MVPLKYLFRAFFAIQIRSLGDLDIKESSDVDLETSAVPVMLG